MKAFVWMYEWKKHEKQIIPKLEVDGGGDVRIEDKTYELETLFGAGDVRGKLTRRKKYKEYYEILLYVGVLEGIGERQGILLSSITADVSFLHAFCQF